MQRSVSHGKTVKSAFLIIIMIIMTQVGYLDLINNQQASNDSLAEETPVFETATGTSVVYGNNTQWAPAGSFETFGFKNSADIIATTDDVILLKGQNGKDGRNYCIIAYNYVNKTSWQPNVIGTSACPGQNSFWKFIGIIDEVTLVRYETGSSNHQGHGIFAYNPSNDSFYEVASLPQSNTIVQSAVMIGRNVYMGTTSSLGPITIFNYDNQTIWSPSLTQPSGCSISTNLFGVVGDKIFTSCGSLLTIFDPATESLSIPSAMSSVTIGLLMDSRTAVIGDHLLLKGDDGVNGVELWVYDASNDSAWMAADIAVGSGSAWGVFGSLNPMRSESKVLFMATDHFSDLDLWWYDSINASVWRATNFSDPNIQFNGHMSERFYGELANGVIAIGYKLQITTNSNSYSYHISFYDPSNGTVWEEPNLYLEPQSSSGSTSSNSAIKLRAVYGNTIFGAVSADTGSPVGNNMKLFAFDITNQTLLYSENLGNAVSTNNDIIQTNMVTFGDHILFGLACGNAIAISCPTIGGGRQAAVAWSPGAIAVNDAWNISAGDRLDGPITGGDGRYYSSGVGVQNLTASSDGAELMVGDLIEDITFQYNASAASGSGSGSSSSSAFAYANDKVSGGTHQTCAILDNGDLKCWGRDNNGQLGDGGSNTNLNAPSSTAIDLGTGRTAVAVSSGDHFTCAILDNGDLKCWGRDQYGQLGDGGGNTNTNAPSSTAIDLGTGRTAISITAGYYHACAILDNGDLKCWGRNNYGQLGDGTGGDFTEDNNRLTPTPTASLGTGRTAVAVSAGFGHTCAILDNGEAKCWGRDQYGQLGDGGPAWTSSNPTDTNAPSSTAIDLGTGRTAIAVSAGHGHTCAILDNGDLKCWGNDGDGQLGDGGPPWTSSNPTSTNTPSSTAIDLGTGRTAVAVSAGRTYHSCAILDNGEAKCWGRDQYGQLGEDPNQNEGNLDPDTMPIDLGTGRTAVAMSAGGPHTCAILDNGDMKCWGNDLFGQLGDGGTNTNQGEPVLVSGSNTWDSSTTASSGSSGGMTNVTGATSCTTSPGLPLGLSIDSSTCTISGTPTKENPFWFPAATPGIPQQQRAAAQAVA